MTNLERWRYFLKDYESPSRFIDWSFYSMIGAALQRRVWLDQEPRMLFPNLYTLLIGPPASGKSLTIAAVAALMRSPLLSHVDPISKQMQPAIPTAPDSITLERFTQSLAEDHNRVHVYTKPDGSNGHYPHCSLYFLAEEMGVLLRKHTEDFVNVLNQGYDARRIERETKGSGRDHVHNVCISMLAGTTPQWMKDSATDKLIGEGFTSRFIMLFESGPRFLREHPGFSEDQYKEWRIIFTHIKEKILKEYGQCVFSEEAAEYRKQFYEGGELTKTRKNFDIHLDHYYSRKNAHWKKLSIIHHFMDPYAGREIGLKSVTDTYKILNDAETNMHLAFTSIGRNALYAIQLQMLRSVELHTQSGGIEYNRLFALFSRDLKGAEFNECVDALCNQNLIVRRGTVFVSVKRKH